MRTFSIEEANLLLPQIIPLLENLRIYTKELRMMRVQESASKRLLSADGNMITTPLNKMSISAQTEKITNCIETIEKHGIFVKDPERGLIDFYHYRNSELVFLCYLLGEKDVKYWHALDTGFHGRNLI